MTASTLDPFDIPTDKVCPRYSTVGCANLHFSRRHLSLLSFRRENKTLQVTKVVVGVLAANEHIVLEDGNSRKITGQVLRDLLKITRF